MENNSIKKRKSVSLVRELLLNEGPHSQASISRKTGLSPAMVNYVVKKLRELGNVDIHWVNGREGIVSLISKTGRYISILVAVDKLAAHYFYSNQNSDLIMSALWTKIHLKKIILML